MTRKTESIVAARFGMLVGKTVALRVAWDQHADILGTLVAIYPVGRAYFVAIAADGRTRMINFEHVLELGEVAS